MIGLIGGYNLQLILKNPKEYRFFSFFPDEKICDRSVMFYLFKGLLNDKDVVLVPRHGKNHEFPPHNIPFKSILIKLKEFGVKRIITINSVGILNKSIKKGSFIILNDFVNEGKVLMFI